MSLLTELKDSLLLGDFDDIRNALTMQNLIEQVHNLGATFNGDHIPFVKSESRE